MSNFNYYQRPPLMFISHRTADNADSYFDAFADFFGAEHIFYDQASNISQISHILNIIPNCSYMVVIIGPRWGREITDRLDPLDPHNEKNNDWVRTEIREALAHSIPILPVFVNGGTMPPDLPLDIIDFSDLIGKQVRSDDYGNKKRDIQDIIEYINGVVLEKNPAMVKVTNKTGKRIEILDQKVNNKDQTWFEVHRTPFYVSGRHFSSDADGFTRDYDIDKLELDVRARANYEVTAKYTGNLLTNLFRHPEFVLQDE